MLGSGVLFIRRGFPFFEVISPVPGIVQLQFYHVSRFDGIAFLRLECGRGLVLLVPAVSSFVFFIGRVFGSGVGSYHCVLSGLLFKVDVALIRYGPLVGGNDGNWFDGGRCRPESDGLL